MTFALMFPGPYEHHDVVVHGHRVPLLTAHPNGEHHMQLRLDHRAGIPTPTDTINLTAAEADHFLPFLAAAINTALQTKPS